MFTRTHGFAMQIIRYYCTYSAISLSSPDSESLSKPSYHLERSREYRRPSSRVKMLSQTLTLFSAHVSSRLLASFSLILFINPTLVFCQDFFYLSITYLYRVIRLLLHITNKLNVNSTWPRLFHRVFHRRL